MQNHALLTKFTEKVTTAHPSIHCISRKFTVNLKETIVRFLNRRGYQIVRFPMKQFLSMTQPEVVLDVGANTGQFATDLREEYRYTNKIISFEPLSVAFESVKHKAAQDPQWTAINSALGSKTEIATINIAGNSASSSLLDMLPKHSSAAPHTATVSTESVDVKRLDDIFEDLVKDNERVLLKIDTQGFEIEVLKGAENTLKHISGVIIEMNLSELYAGAPMAEEVISHLRRTGFVPYWFSHGFRDRRSQQLLQIDGYFIRSDLT